MSVSAADYATMTTNAQMDALAGIQAQNDMTEINTTVGAAATVNKTQEAAMENIKDLVKSS